ncbi:iron complex transport system ATP-binding protein [Alkalibacillus flavidus]|uniref:Iron complex transport system ATP-binding protein n=1 Tax=Alkalibacillus flavidus TaxID=546021 RepID=A0ABV2KWF7_9BACI
MLSLQHVTKMIDAQPLVSDVSFDVEKGQCFGLIGPNGAGKSTLMKLISGVYDTTGGQVRLDGQPIKRWSHKKRAQRVSVLTQDGLSPYPISVLNAVMMGRYPHLKFFQRESDDDMKRVQDVLAITGLSNMQDQMLDTLSGGERQRVAIAKAMVQEPDLLLLDEPTSYLDIGYQTEVLNLVQDWQKRTGLTVLMVLHDLNLAAQYCDRLILMDKGEVVKEGTSDDILTTETLATVYQTTPEIVRHPTKNIPQILL